MIPGYNHNIRYQDDVYHIQTEDSGVQNPHIITHLFVGGNIVETRKTSYADIVNSERLGELLVDLMQDQHKQMLKDLIGGRLDARIQTRSAGAGRLDGPTHQRRGGSTEPRLLRHTRCSCCSAPGDTHARAACAATCTRPGGAGTACATP